MSKTTRTLTGRRAEYAAATRQAIVEAARRLFSTTGYFATKVDDIAREARVAPATVYAVSGGKLQLLRDLIEEYSTTPRVAELLERIAHVDDPVEIIRSTVTAAGELRREWADVIDITLSTAPHEASVAESLALTTQRYRDGCRSVAQRLEDLATLRPGVDVERAVDLLWFFLGYRGFATLHDDNRWSWAEAESWLTDMVISSLLADRA